MSEVREGYKMTELGEIPVEWKVLTIEKIVNKIVGGGTPSRENESYYVGKIPWITVKDMQGAFYQGDAQEYINEDAVKNSSTNLIEPGNVIIATRIALGRGFISTNEVAINQDLKALYLDVNKVMNEYFLYWYLHNAELIKGLGSGSTVKGIRVEQLKSLQLPIPLLFEQQKIASILSTVDEQIEETEQLIEKTEELKKGLMQQLLTKGIGHTEFKQTELGEIPSEWEVKHLSDVLTVGYGKNQKDVEVPKSEIPILGTGGIIGWSNKALYDRPSVLIGRKGTIDKPRYIDTPFWTIDTLFYTDIDNKLTTPKFIYYLFQTIDWYKYNEATGVPSLSASNISKITFASPILEEQQKIASILSTVDEQIEAYEEEKAKYEELKKGLMQKLLTGQIRVKI